MSVTGAAVVAVVILVSSSAGRFDPTSTSPMLKIYTALAFVVAAAIGVEDSFRGADHQFFSASCSAHAVICAGGTEYHWASALSVAVVALAILVWVGWPIIIAGRIGRARNRRGYLAGIFFGWVGLAWVVLRPAREGRPDALQRALQDYRAPGHMSD
jgi:predicted cobalt transporter CbtA